MALTNALVLSFDSLVAGVALAPLLPKASHRLAAVVLFGVTDAAASLAGASIAISPRGLLVVAPGLLALYGVYLVAATTLASHGLRRAKDPGRPTRVRSPQLPRLAIVGALAVALSIDNLLSAVSGPVVLMGAMSAALMVLGLAVGGRLVRCEGDRPRAAWVGIGLTITACLALVA